jgi:hypothetical protein
MTVAQTLPTFWPDGACLDLPAEWFHPERGESTRDAKAVCATCPVHVECLTWALANHERFGIWGGTSERERRRIRCRLAAGQAVPELTPEWEPVWWGLPARLSQTRPPTEEEPTVELTVVDPPAPTPTTSTNGTGHPGRTKRDCDECGEPYYPVRTDQRYCSKTCRKTRSNRETRARITAAGAAPKRGRPPKSPPGVAPAATAGTVEAPTPPTSTATPGGADLSTRQLAIDLLGVLLDARNSGSREADEQVNALAGRLALQVIAA